MSDPFIAEIRAFGFPFAPSGWAFCNGQILPTNQFSTLYSLLGSIYGGNGTTNFALPNLQSRTTCSTGQGPGLSTRTLGVGFGTPSVTLQTQQIPTHQHSFLTLTGTGDQQQDKPTANCHLAHTLDQFDFSSSTTPNTQLEQMIGPTGSGGPHNNLQPFLTVNYCIAMTGVYPPRS